MLVIAARAEESVLPISVRVGKQALGVALMRGCVEFGTVSMHREKFAIGRRSVRSPGNKALRCHICSNFVVVHHDYLLSFCSHEQSWSRTLLRSLYSKCLFGRSGARTI